MDKGKLMRVCIRGMRVNEVDVCKLGRSCYGWEGSCLGNKIRIGVARNRDEVIEKHKRWLWNEINREGVSDVRFVLSCLKCRVLLRENVMVGCWCGLDERCHVDVVISCVNWMIEKGKG
jgi:hypothetical protein